MPNGSPDFDEKVRPLLDQFFAPVADLLERFAQEHNLLLTCYWHQEHCWDYMFRHPLSGVGRIMIYKEGDDRLSLNSLWWVDRFDEFARYLRRRDIGTIPRDPAALAPVLDRAFAEVLGWQEGDLEERSGCEDVWSRTTKEAFESVIDYYPIPRV